MGITHVLLMQFKTGVSPDVIKDACAEVIALKDTCTLQSTQQPYIKSFRGGKDSSPEGFQHGMTHAFIAEFETAEDRDYYVSSDPVHLALGKRLNEIVEKVIVVDFTDDVL